MTIGKQVMNLSHHQMNFNSFHEFFIFLDSLLGTPLDPKDLNLLNLDSTILH